MEKKADLKGIRDRMKESLDSMKESAKNIKVPEAKLPDVKSLFKKKEEVVEEVKEPEITSVSTRSALKIFYYLMAVDGEVFHSEEEKYDLIGQEITPYYVGMKKDVIAECQKQMDTVVEAEDFYDILQDGVEQALTVSSQDTKSFITPKLLVWDMLAIAHSDNSYDEAERKLVKYVVRKLRIDRAVFLEMESTIQTLIDIEKELQWIKTTNRPYLTIESMVNELEDRKRVIFESVKDLITL